jgi:hypothetical protein
VRRIVGLVLALLFVGVAYGDTRIKVKLSQAGRGKAAAGVALVDASTTQVVDAATLRAPFRGRVGAAAGTYFLVADVVRFSASVGGLGGLFAVADERKARKVVALAPSAGVVGAVAAARRGSGGGGAVATMGPVVVVGPAGAAAFDGPLLTVLFDKTHDPCGLVWVDSSRRVIDARQQALDLQAQGRLDPSTPVRDERLFPTVRVEGTFSDDGATIAGELRLIDIASGRILARRQFEGRSRKFFALYVDWGMQFAGDICDTLGAPATTTTSTTGASTTTSPGGCTTDEDCGPCSCCNPVFGTCGTVLGGSLHCCAFEPPMPLLDICGPKQPAFCPTDTTCNPPGQIAGGWYYNCQGCPSGNILEWYAPGTSQDRSNCVRR